MKNKKPEKTKSQAEIEIEALAQVFNIATTGFEAFSKAAKEIASGYSSTAASSGDCSACTAIGYRAAVKGDIGNLLMASEYVLKDGKHVPVGGKADLVDGKKIKPNSWYIVEGGECYYDGTSLGASEFIPTFLAGGSDAVWKMLEEEYRERFGATEADG